MPEVAVVVVSYNTVALLEACLRSLEPDVRSGLAEVWVVDNGSSDGSAERVRSAFGWATLVEPGRNLGFGAAVNLVAERTATPFVVAANADVEVEPGALRALLDAAVLDPAAGALAPRLVLPDGSVQHSVFPFPTAVVTAAVVLGLGHRRLCVPGSWDPEEQRRVPWAVGAFLLVRRAAWDAAGGFDAAQWMYAEDLDLGWRLRRAGWATRYVPGARVRHAEAASTRAAWGDGRTERWQRATYAWIRRRLGARSAVAVASLSVAGALLRAVLQPRRARFYLRWARLHGRTGLRAPGGERMRAFWDDRAREDALHFVDSREPYRGADAERFWAEGERDLDRLLETLGLRVEPGDRVLDLGCGVGRLTRVLASRASAVIALDVSAEMLSRARALNDELANVEWVHGDGTTLAGVGDASVDAAVSHVVLQHIPDAEVQLGYFAELGRVLRPGGWAAFSLSTDPALHRPRGSGLRDAARVALRRAPRGRGAPEWLGAAVSVEGLRVVADAAGLELEQVHGAGTQFTLVRARRRVS